MNTPFIIQDSYAREEKILTAVRMLKTPKAQNSFIELCDANPTWAIFSNCGLMQKSCAGLIDWKTGMAFKVEDDGEYIRS